MPSHYSHYYFGKEVTRILNDDVKDIINTSRDCVDAFIIGQQGPDILAFYRPYTRNRLNREGRSIHHHSGKDFFEQAVKTAVCAGTPESYSYLFGCFCHYMLDSACHPLVSRYMKELDLTHAKIEREFDSYIIRICGKNPLGLDTSILLPLNPALGPIISPFYHDIPAEKINASIESMSRILGLMACRSRRKRETLYNLLSNVPIEAARSKRDMIVQTEHEALTDLSNAKLWDALNKCVGETALELDYFMDTVLLGKPLSDRLLPDYLGKVPEGSVSESSEN